MPNCSSKMSCQEFDRVAETPDRSLGSLSLTATGEQLDEIQLNLDRMYLESPAPASIQGFAEFASGHVGARNIDNLLAEADFPPGEPNPEAFDRLPLIDVKKMFPTIDCVDWLYKPPGRVADNFTENDRSFLDTNLLYTRYNLLNYVTRIINEDIYAETQKSCPPSTQSNLSNESAGSGATFRVNRPPRRSLIGGIRRISDGAGDAEMLAHNGEESENNLLSAVYESSAGSDASAISSQADVSTGKTSEMERRQKYLTYRRPPMQRQRDIVSFSHDSSHSSAPSSDGSTPPPSHQNDSGHIEGMRLHFNNSRNSGQSGKVTSNGDRNYDFSSNNGDENGFIPNEFSPIESVGGLRPSKHGNEITPPTDNFCKPLVPANRLRNPLDEPCSDDSNTGSLSHEIDTRTYTRPKKSRMSLGTPNRVLNTTLSLSPFAPGSRGETTPQRQLNTTIDLSPIESPPRPILGSASSSMLNRTIDIPHDANSIRSRHESPHESSRHLLNTTVDMTPERSGAASTNLNETFVAESTPTDRSRRVTRNLSYVIRRDEESPNNNASPQGSSQGKADLNNTFMYEAEGDVSSPVTRGSQNTSMEDLNSRVASQIRSLGCSTISRSRMSEGAGRVGPNLDETRLVARTSSTDTYSVAHSSESPTSSGLSSPMDAQSYDDIQTESVRRSMPNLAVIRSSTITRSNLALPQAGSGQLRKNHYISDSKLFKGIERPKLSIHSASSQNATLSRGLRPPESLRTSRGVGSNTSTPAALNRISAGAAGFSTAGAPRVYSAQALGSATITRASSSIRQPGGGSMGNVRSTGLAAPRYTSASSASTMGSALRPPKATPTAHSVNETTTRNSTAPGIPVPTYRSQSRIPGPGQLRFSRPPTSKLPYRGGNPPRPSTSQRGSVDDWRDGCY